MFPNSNINRQFVPKFNQNNFNSPYNGGVDTNNMNMGKVQFTGSRMPQYGGNMGGSNGGNMSNLGAYTAVQYGKTKPQYYGSKVENMENCSSFEQDSPVQNQSFNMSAQLHSFQQRNSSRVAPNPNTKMALGEPSSFQQNVQAFYGQISKKNLGVDDRLMSTSRTNFKNNASVQNVQMRNLGTSSAASNNVQSISRSETITSVQPSNNTLSLLNLPKPKFQQKPEQYNLESKEKAAEQSQNAGSKLMSRFGDSLMEQTFIFTGTAERVIKWGKIFENRFCLFEVISAVIQIAEGKVNFEKVLLLKDKKGPVLQVTYFSNSTHVNIENFNFGQMLSCVGRMVGPNILSASAIRAATPGEIETLPRLCCACDRAVQYFCGVQNQV